MTLSYEVGQHPDRAPSFALKRTFDICVSAFGLIALAPILAIVAAAIRIDDGGPALYRQIRVGRNGTPFRIVKFRSMRAERESRGSELTVSGDNRITRIGGLIRRFKIDELPQLWNVLLGEMSLVGPRPETPALMQHYNPGQRSALISLKPGVTDWASLLLRSESELLAQAADPAAFYHDILVPLKCDLCNCYRSDGGFLADLRIIAATVWAVAAPNVRNPWLSAHARACYDRALIAPAGERGQPLQ